jgi:hypothetical protein
VATLHFPAESFPLAVAPEVTGERTWAWREDDGFACRITGPGARLRISGDSLLVISFDRSATLRVEGHFAPAYHASREGMVAMSPELRRPAGQLDGKWLILDKQGGVGVYPVADKKVAAPQFENTPWSIEYGFGPGEELWLGVCPPRPYNWRRSFESLAHEGLRFTPAQAFPSERIIRLNAVHNRVQAVHSYFWPGGEREPWFIRDFYPMDIGAFERMRDQVHRHGMKLVVYFSPFYARVPDFFFQVQRALDELKVDGLYYDGVSTDFRKSYEIVHKTRRLLGDDRILYIHCSVDPFGSRRLYCPFIDTYADYILRGESQRGGLERKDYLRWVVSGYQISNSVGIWCHYGSAGEEKKYVHVVPSTADIEAALDNHARIWMQRMAWESPKLYRGGGQLTQQQRLDEIERFEREYYGRLKAMENAHFSGENSGEGPP